MRMSGLCKIEMSGSIGRGEADGTGAHCIEPEGGGWLEGVQGGGEEAGEERGRGGRAGGDRPPYPASFGAAAPVRRWGAGARAAGTALQPPSAGVVCAA